MRSRIRLSGRTGKGKKVAAVLLPIKKRQFRCQRCLRSLPVDTAHARKRSSFNPRTNERWLPTDDDHPNNIWWFIVAFLCRRCHEELENGTGPDPHGRMLRVIEGIYKKFNQEEVIEVVRLAKWCQGKEWVELL
jgi:hypothetical protein